MQIFGKTNSDEQSGFSETLFLFFQNARLFSSSSKDPPLFFGFSDKLVENYMVSSEPIFMRYREGFKYFKKYFLGINEG